MVFYNAHPGFVEYKKRANKIRSPSFEPDNIPYRGQGHLGAAAYGSTSPSISSSMDARSRSSDFPSATSSSLDEDEDTWSLDGLESGLDLTDSELEAERPEIWTSHSGSQTKFTNQTYPWPSGSRRSHTLPSGFQPNTSSGLGKQGPSRGGTFKTSPRRSSQFDSSSPPRPNVSAWISESESESESSLTTDEANRGRFAYTRPSSNMRNFYERPSANFYSVPQIEESESSDSEDDDESNSEDFLSNSSDSTPTPAGEKRPPQFSFDPKILREAFKAYDARWNALTKGLSNMRTLSFQTIPWPQYPPPSGVADINVSGILNFLKQDGTPKVAVRHALLRFHPDKIAVLLGRVEEGEREKVVAACTAVARCLNEINRRL